MKFAYKNKINLTTTRLTILDELKIIYLIVLRYYLMSQFNVIMFININVIIHSVIYEIHIIYLKLLISSK